MGTFLPTAFTRVGKCWCLPPTNVSSASTSPASGMRDSAFIARRMRWNMNHAVFCVTPSARASSCELVPFLVFASSQKAGSHLVNGIGESSKIVPTLTLNCRLHSLQRHSARRNRLNGRRSAALAGASNAVGPAPPDRVGVGAIRVRKVGDGFEEGGRRPVHAPTLYRGCACWVALFCASSISSWQMSSSSLTGEMISSRASDVNHSPTSRSNYGRNLLESTSEPLANGLVAALLTSARPKSPSSGGSADFLFGTRFCSFRRSATL